MIPTRARALLQKAFGLALLPALLLLGGCITQWHYDLGEHIDEEEMPLPPTGTTLADTLVMLGPPHRMSASDTGYLLAWEHWDVLETKVGFSLGAAGADFLSADWGRMRAKGEGPQAIANALNAENRRTRSGKRWTRITVWQILDSYENREEALAE